MHRTQALTASQHTGTYIRCQGGCLQEKALCPTKVTDLRDNLLQCIAQNMEPSEHSPAQPSPYMSLRGDEDGASRAALEGRAGDVCGGAGDGHRGAAGAAAGAEAARAALPR